MSCPFYVVPFFYTREYSSVIVRSSVGADATDCLCIRWAAYTMPLDSLSIDTAGKGSTTYLLTRSCFVVFAVFSLIVLINCLPHGRKSPVRASRSTSDAEQCAGDATLRHLIVLHRHGVLDTAADYVDECACCCGICLLLPNMPAAEYAWSPDQVAECRADNWACQP